MTEHKCYATPVPVAVMRQETFAAAIWADEVGLEGLETAALLGKVDALLDAIQGAATPRHSVRFEIRLELVLAVLERRGTFPRRLVAV